MGGEVAARAKNFVSKVSGKGAFLLATAQVFLAYPPKTAELTVDGEEHGPYTITNIAIGNGRYHGGGMHVCPKALLDDGELEVTVIEALSSYELLRDIKVLYSENLYVHPKTHHLRGRRISARSAATGFDRSGRRAAGRAAPGVFGGPRELSAWLAVWDNSLHDQAQSERLEPSI